MIFHVRFEDMTERRSYKSVLPYAVMVAVECANVGLNTLFKAASLKGMSSLVFMAYSYALASLFLLPSPIFSHRSSELPPLSFSILCKIGLLGLIGSTSQIMGYTGVNYSSPTLSAAIANLVPAFTFILAILFGMEKVSLRKTSSVAKILGTIVSITGAFVVTLYKGPSMIRGSRPFVSLHVSLHESSNSNWGIGGVFFTAEYILVPVWYIVQTQIMKEYPAELTVVFFYNLSVSFISAIVGLIMEKNGSAWRIRLDITLASIACSALLGSCTNNIVHTWALRIRGPVFVAMFRPLSISIAVVMGITFLGDFLYLGSLIGGIIISIGFYAVMWGKANEGMDEDSK